MDMHPNLDSPVERRYPDHVQWIMTGDAGRQHPGQLAGRFVTDSNLSPQELMAANLGVFAEALRAMRPAMQGAARIPADLRKIFHMRIFGGSRSELARETLDLLIEAERDVEKAQARLSRVLLLVEQGRRRAEGV